MRKCAVLCVAFLAVLSFSVPEQISAQGVFLGAGVTIPTQDYKDFGYEDPDGAKTGFMTVGGVSFPINEEGLSAFGEGFYGKNNHEVEGDGTDLYGGMAGVLYDFAGEGEAGPYVFGQAGFMVHKDTSDDTPQLEESNTGFAAGGGAGYGFPLGGINGWIEGRYTFGKFDDRNTTFLSAMAGISFPLGGGN